jgi:hypothetical protein
VLQLLTALLLSPVVSEPDWLELTAMGFSYMQPFLFAGWMVLGDGRWARRVPWTLYAFAVLLLIPAPDSGSSMQPEEVTVRAVEFALTGPALLVLRQWTGWRISRQPAHTAGKAAPIRFSTQSLLIWTAAWAVYLAALRMVSRGLSSSQLFDWEEVFVYLTVFPLILAPLALAGLALLEARPRSVFRHLAFIIWLVASVAGVIYLKTIDADGLSIFAAISLGGGTALALAVIPLRAAGYRLHGRTPNVLPDS